MLLLLGLAGVWLRSSVPDRFANYQVRMVSEAQRGHTMGLVTKDMLRNAKDLFPVPHD